MAALFALTLWALRAAVIERGYSQAAVTERDLGGDVVAGGGSSEFADLMGLTVHYRGGRGAATHQKASPEGFDDIVKSVDVGRSMSVAPILAMHCYHGFGATSFTFDELISTLPRMLVKDKTSSSPLCTPSSSSGSSSINEAASLMITVHDTPGFGLTSRPKDLSSYYLAFNGMLGRGVQDEAIRRMGVTDDDERGDITPAVNITPPAASSGIKSRPSTRPLIRRALLGHSVGAISAALQAIEGPQDVELLVLVAPAILIIPGMSSGKSGSGGSVLKEVVASSLSGHGVDGGNNVRSRVSVTAAGPGGGDGEGQDDRDQREERRSGREGTSATRRRYVLETPEASDHSGNDSGNGGRSDSGRSQELSDIEGPCHSNVFPSFANKVRTGMGLLLSRVLATCYAAALLALLLLLRALRLLTVVLLRALVRNRGFWEKGLQAAFYDKSRITDKVGGL